MAPQSDIAKIGEEGFDLIDQVFGRKSRPTNHVQPPPKRTPAAAPPATTFHADHPQSYHNRYQPQESYHVYQPLQESNTVRVTKGFAEEATVVSSYRYEAAAKSLENMQMEYQKPAFRMP